MILVSHKPFWISTVNTKSLGIDKNKPIQKPIIQQYLPQKKISFWTYIFPQQDDHFKGVSFYRILKLCWKWMAVMNVSKDEELW